MKIHRLRARLGLDFHVLRILLLRGWSIIAGAVMVIAIPVWFSKIEQGYYFTFASLLALQIFFELGINQVVVQIVAHEAAHLHFPDDAHLSGPKRHIDRLSSLSLAINRWYLVAATLYALTVSGVGVAFFSQRPELPLAVWAPPWILLVFSTAFNLYFSPSLAIFEGCGRIGQVARMRLRQSVVGFVLMWVAMSVGAGLWAVPLMPMTAAVFTAIWIRRDGQLLTWLRSRNPTASSAKIDWQTEIFPFQWRIAVSWISGYLIFQLFTPLVFAHQGAKEAGRLGMALNVFSTIVSVGMSWSAAKVPDFAGMIAHGQRAQLNQLFKSVLVRSMSFTALATSTVVAVVWAAKTAGFSFINRISEIEILVCLTIVSLTNSYIFSAATYMRAHKEEPMLWPSLATGILVLAAAEYGSRISVLVTMSLYAAITCLIALPWTAMLLRSYLRRS